MCFLSLSLLPPTFASFRSHAHLLAFFSTRTHARTHARTHTYSLSYTHCLSHGRNESLVFSAFLYAHIHYAHTTHARTRARAHTHTHTSPCNPHIFPIDPSQVCKQGFAELQKDKSFALDGSETLPQRGYADFLSTVMFTRKETHPIPAAMVGPVTTLSPSLLPSLLTQNMLEELDIELRSSLQRTY